jgi:hypothetical protein
MQPQRAAAPSCSHTTRAAVVQCNPAAEKLSLAPSQGRRPLFSFPWSSSTPPDRCSSTKSRHSRTPPAAAGARGGGGAHRLCLARPCSVRPPPCYPLTRSVEAWDTSSGEVRPSPAGNSTAGEVQSARGTVLQRLRFV